MTEILFFETSPNEIHGETIETHRGMSQLHIGRGDTNPRNEIDCVNKTLESA